MPNWTACGHSPPLLSEAVWRASKLCLPTVKVPLNSVFSSTTSALINARCTPTLHPLASPEILSLKSAYQFHIENPRHGQESKMTCLGPQQAAEMLQKRFTHLCWKILREAVSVLSPLLSTEYDKITQSQCKFVISCEGRVYPTSQKGRRSCQSILTRCRWSRKEARPQISWHQLIYPKWNYFASSNIVTGQNHILSRHFLDHMHCCVLRNVHGSQLKNLPGVNLTHTGVFAQ